MWRNSVVFNPSLTHSAGWSLKVEILHALNQRYDRNLGIIINMHNVGLNTSVQSWSKPFVWTFTSVFFFAHTFCFFVGIIVAPQLFSSSSIVGDVCQPQNLSLSNGKGQRDVDTKECIALGPVAIPPVPLEDTIISFRFPEPSNEVSICENFYAIIDYKNHVS